MIICYRLTGHRQSIDLCGDFRDWSHFAAFAQNEAFRGWKVIGASVLERPAQEQK